jgi:DNA (cytosine-5)-methyltransferase 1
VVHGGRRRCVGRAARVLTVGSLFSGIGGFDLGFERTGHMRTVWFCEQDPFCQRVLGKHWPGVPVYPDVRALVADTALDGRGSGRAGRPDPDGARQLEPALREGVPVPVPYVDVLCGGFPCQDISVAGRGEGIDGARSGLWGEYARLIRDLRPRYVVVENVAALLARGMERVLGDLAACGYDAEWDCIPASAVGAPHRRDRVWLVAYAQQSGLEGHGAVAGQAEVPESRNGRSLADADRLGAHGAGALGEGGREESADGRGGTADVAYADERADVAGLPQPVQRSVPRGAEAGWHSEQWLSEPDVGRVAHGVPARVDRLRSLGNALVPQIAEWIGRRIMADAGL